MYICTNRYTQKRARARARCLSLFLSLSVFLSHTPQAGNRRGIA